jgi:hypothetical protein
MTTPSKIAPLARKRRRQPALTHHVVLVPMSLYPTLVASSPDSEPHWPHLMANVCSHAVGTHITLGWLLEHSAFTRDKCAHFLKVHAHRYFTTIFDNDDPQSVVYIVSPQICLDVVNPVPQPKAHIVSCAHGLDTFCKAHMLEVAHSAITVRAISTRRLHPC